jgi:hypothetical protein
MIKIITVAALLAVSSASAQTRIQEFTPQPDGSTGIVVCPASQDRWVDGVLYCLIPIRQKPCDTTHNTVCRGGVSPYTGHGH